MATIGAEVIGTAVPLEKKAPSSLTGEGFSNFRDRLLNQLTRSLAAINPLSREQALKVENSRLTRERDGAVLALRFLIVDIAVLGHDLRGPLTVIKGQGQMVERIVDRETGLSERGRKSILGSTAAIGEGTNRLEEFIRDLVESAKDQQEKDRGKKVPFNEVSSSIKQDLVALSNLNNVKFREILPESNDKISSGIIKIVDEFGKNAIGAMGDNPDGQVRNLTVSYEIFSQQEIIRIAITDTGPGMSKERLATVGRISLTSGHGFGIFGAIRRVAESNGEVFYTSRGVTMNVVTKDIIYNNPAQANEPGTVVTIVLPLAK